MDTLDNNTQNLENNQTPAAQDAAEQPAVQTPPPAAAQEAPQKSFQLPPPVQKQNTNGFAVAALALGIASIVFFWFPFLGIPCAVVGLIMGIVAITKKVSRSMSITGTVLSGVGVLFSIIFIAAILIFSFSTAKTILENPDKWDRGHIYDDFYDDFDADLHDFRLELPNSVMR